MRKLLFVISIIMFYNINAQSDSLQFPGEVHLKNIRQLTFGGNNAEAYFSFDDKSLVFQSDWKKINSQDCDQIFSLDLDKNELEYKLQSTGTGRTTCSYYMPDGRIVYASTHAKDHKCPEVLMFSGGRYVWQIYDSFDIYVTGGKSITSKSSGMNNSNSSSGTNSIEGTNPADGANNNSGHGPSSLEINSNERNAVNDKGNENILLGKKSSNNPEISIMENSDNKVTPYVEKNLNHEAELLIGGQGYDAEATVSPDGKWIIFTSTRSGDLELWRYEIATGNLLQLTNTLGYDGGAFFSRDSKKIVWRASRPQGDEAIAYKKLLKENLVEPKELNIFVADIDGKNVKQVTNLAGANWAPFFHPSGEKVLFCSNHHSQDQGGRIFDIFMINLDGTGLEQITNSGTFDAFPMFSYDGTKLVFCSNRRADRKQSRDTNIFIADWVENPGEKK